MTNSSFDVTQKKPLKFQSRASKFWQKFRFQIWLIIKKEGL